MFVREYVVFSVNLAFKIQILRANFNGIVKKHQKGQTK